MKEYNESSKALREASNKGQRMPEKPPLNKSELIKLFRQKYNDQQLKSCIEHINDLEMATANQLEVVSLMRKALKLPDPYRERKKLRS